MINFRFHLVSLVAVFLAVGLGILVGSTVVDQKIVNRLDTEIRSVRKENSQRKDESKQLADENSRQQSFIDSAAPFAVDARLDGQSVAIVAERGVDSGVVKQAQTLLRDAGADAPAVLWLEDAWQLDTSQRIHDLESAMSVSGSPTTVRTRALRLLAHRLAKAPKRSASTSTSRSTPRVATNAPSFDALGALEDAGFVSVADGDAAELDAFPAHASRVLVITGDKSHFLGTEMTSVFVRALIGAKLPTVVAAVYDPGSNASKAPQRGAALASILDDRVLSKSVSTLDDLEVTQGRIAAVLALEVVGSGNSGHYGYGTGASAPLPPHPS